MLQKQRGADRCECLLLNIKYNNGKENKEGWNLRKVRNPLRCLHQKGSQEIRNHPKSQIRQSIQRKGKSPSPSNTSNFLFQINRRASEEKLSESGNARALEERSLEVPTCFQPPLLLPPRPPLPVFVDSERSVETNERSLCERLRPLNSRLCSTAT